MIEAPAWLAMLATARPEFRRRMCPVSLAPTGARLIVEPGATLRGELAAVRGVAVAEPGVYVPLPPTRVLAGHVTWCVTPAHVAWRLGDGETVQDALLAALADDPHDPAGEVRA